MQTRRAFLGSGLAALGMLQAPGSVAATPVLAKAPPIFCTAYVNPLKPDQAGQEPIVARYPLALVPQDMRRAFVTWRDRVRSINPAIVLLGYQNVFTETSVPGPGHDVMRRRISKWCVYPDGYVPVVPGTSERRRLADPRAPEFAPALIEACRATLASYPYQGLFLDNCTVYPIAHPDPAVRAAMLDALAQCVVQVRAALPDAILIGNCRYDFAGLNGEMNEGRLLEAAQEFKPFAGHAQPQIDLMQLLIKQPTNRLAVSAGLKFASAAGVAFAAAVDYQHVLWFDLFDAAMAKYRAP